MTTKSAKKIYGNLARISKVFEERLNYSVSYNDVLEKFIQGSKFGCIIFAALSAMTLCFIFYFNQSAAFFWALLSVFPYFMISIGFWKFVYYIQLTTLNISAMKNVLQDALDAKNFFHTGEIHFKVQPKSLQNSNTFYTISNLKQIYLILNETVGLINSLCSIGIINQLITSVASDISAGFKVYLLSTGQLNIERIGGDTFFL